MIINYFCKIVSFRSKIFKYLCRDLQAISTTHEIIRSEDIARKRGYVLWGGDYTRGLLVLFTRYNIVSGGIIIVTYEPATDACHMVVCFQLTN